MLRQRFHLLESAAARLGAGLRQERFKAEDDLAPARGGLARIGGRCFIFLNRADPLTAKVEVLARAVAELARDGAWLPPAVRELVEELDNRSEEDAES